MKILKYLDIFTLCAIPTILVLSYVEHELYEVLAFTAISSVLPWAGCMIIGPDGAPARWGPLFTNKFVLTGFCAYGSLLVFLAVGAMLAMLLMFFTDMHESVGDVWSRLVATLVVSTLAVFRVFLPLTVCLFYKCFKMEKQAPL